MTSKDLIKKIKACQDDKEVWEILIKADSTLFTIQLDNDETFICAIESEDYYRLNNYIGQSMGLCMLLEALGFDAEYV